MSAEMLENKESGICLTRFFNGLEMCYQITADSSRRWHSYIQLTEEQMKAVVEAYNRGIKERS